MSAIRSNRSVSEARLKLTRSRPQSVADSTGRTPVLGVCWIARDFAKVEDQVRFLAGTLRRRKGEGGRMKSSFGTTARYAKGKAASMRGWCLRVRLPLVSLRDFVSATLYVLDSESFRRASLTDDYPG